MAKKINFTKPLLDRLVCPKGVDRLYTYDAKNPGLTLCVTSAGAKSFYVYRRGNGRPQRIRLGGFPELSIEQARNLTAQVNADIAKGIDPQARKRAERGEPTFAELFRYYMETHAKPHKKTWREDEQKFVGHLRGWHNRKLSEITRTHVRSLHIRIGQTTPGSANRVLALVSTLFNKAVDLGFQGTNPARGIKRFPEHSRERFLHADELPRFFQAVADEPNAVLHDFFLIALLTGARRANVEEMRWEDINLDRGTWKIPDTKSGEPQTVHLSPPAIEILQRRQATMVGEWVFPSYGKTGHLVEPKKAWNRLLDRAEISDLRIHDLRRTLGSWQAATGASLPVIGKSLGHKNQATTAIYARLDLDPVRQAVNTATAAMLAAGGLGKRGK